MDIQPEILDRHVEAAAIEQIAGELGEKGYDIEQQALIRGYQFDLVARRDKQTIAYEFKIFRTGQRTSEKSLNEAQAIARDLGFEFRLVIVRPPKYTHVNIEGLETKLLNRLSDNVPAGLAEIGHNVIIEDVYDVEVESTDIDDDEIEVEGTGVISATIQSGEEIEFAELFPFKFSLVMKSSDQIIDSFDCFVDTSVWYGEAAE